MTYPKGARSTPPSTPTNIGGGPPAPPMHPEINPKDPITSTQADTQQNNIGNQTEALEILKGNLDYLTVGGWHSFSKNPQIEGLPDVLESLLNPDLPWRKEELQPLLSRLETTLSAFKDTASRKQLICPRMMLELSNQIRSEVAAEVEENNLHIQLFMEHMLKSNPGENFHLNLHPLYKDHKSLAGQIFQSIFQGLSTDKTKPLAAELDDLMAGKSTAKQLSSSPDSVLANRLKSVLKEKGTSNFLWSFYEPSAFPESDGDSALKEIDKIYYDWIVLILETYRNPDEWKKDLAYLQMLLKTQINSCPNLTKILEEIVKDLEIPTSIVIADFDDTAHPSTEFMGSTEFKSFKEGDQFWKNGLSIEDAIKHLKKSVYTDFLKSKLNNDEKTVEYWIDLIRKEIRTIIEDTGADIIFVSTGRDKFVETLLRSPYYGLSPSEVQLVTSRLDQNDQTTVHRPFKAAVFAYVALVYGDSNIFSIGDGNDEKLAIRILSEIAADDFKQPFVTEDNHFVVEYRLSSMRANWTALRLHLNSLKNDNDYDSDSDDDELMPVQPGDSSVK